MKKDVLSFNASRALADAYVYKAMAMEYLQIVTLSEVSFIFKENVYVSTVYCLTMQHKFEITFKLS